MKTGLLSICLLLYLYCLEESLVWRCTGKFCGMNDRKTEAAQGLLLWAQSPTLMMAFPSSSHSHPHVPLPSVYLGSPGLDLEYILIPGFQSQFLLFTGGQVSKELD